MVWTVSIWLILWLSRRFLSDINELSSSVNWGEFVVLLSDYKLLKIDYVPWRVSYLTSFWGQKINSFLLLLAVQWPTRRLTPSRLSLSWPQDYWDGQLLSREHSLLPRNESVKWSEDLPASCTIKQVALPVFTVLVCRLTVSHSGR